jgi:protein-disulfide isomerase
LKQEYIDTGKVYYVFKDYPIKQLHPQAEIASQAAECAGEQGKYWEMHAALFEHPAEWDTTEEVARTTMDRYATDLALEAGQFTSCMEPDSPARADVEANMAEGRRLGLNGTPAFVVNGKLLSGAQPLDVFQRVFDRELKSVGAE